MGRAGSFRSRSIFNTRSFIPIGFCQRIFGVTDVIAACFISFLRVRTLARRCPGQSVFCDAQIDNSRKWLTTHRTPCHHVGERGEVQRIVNSADRPEDFFVVPGFEYLKCLRCSSRERRRHVRRLNSSHPGEVGQRHIGIPNIVRRCRALIFVVASRFPR